MATLYITNTNATGSRTLVAALEAAQTGDTIAPDPTLFAAGERVVISLAAPLRIPVSVAIDAGKTRLILTENSGAVIDARDVTGFNDFDARGVAFIGRVLVGGDSATTLNCNFYN